MLMKTVGDGHLDPTRAYRGISLVERFIEMQPEASRHLETMVKRGKTMVNHDINHVFEAVLVRFRVIFKINHRNRTETLLSRLFYGPLGP